MPMSARRPGDRGGGGGKRGREKKKKNTQRDGHGKGTSPLLARRRDVAGPHTENARTQRIGRVPCGADVRAWQCRHISRASYGGCCDKKEPDDRPVCVARGSTRSAHCRRVGTSQAWVALRALSRVHRCRRQGTGATGKSCSLYDDRWSSMWSVECGTSVPREIEK